MTLFQSTGRVVAGRKKADLDAHGTINCVGFEDRRTWRPAWMAVRMSQGYRMVPVDVGVHDYLDEAVFDRMWRPASSDHKRLPHMAAVEMWVRHAGTHA